MKPKPHNPQDRHWLKLGISPQRKAAYVRASWPRKLTTWMLQTLDHEASYKPKDTNEN